MDHITQVCDGCVISKHHRTPFPDASSYRAEDPLQLVHGDLCGPVSPAAMGGNQYFLLVVDDFSRYMWVKMLKSKCEAFVAFKKIQARAESEVDVKLRALRTDRGGEFTSTIFEEYCDEKGIVRYLTAPYSPQQNGVIERRNQTVVAMARS